MIRDMAQRLQFPDEAIDYLCECYEKMISVKGVPAQLQLAMDKLYYGEKKAYVPDLQEISEKTGVNRFSVDLVFLLMSSYSLYYIYRQKGYSEQFFLDTMADLRIKLYECKEMRGVWGNFVIPWYKGFFDVNRFSFGRLQVDRYPCPVDYNDKIKAGDMIYSCHIPSHSGPLDEESVKESFRRAYAFFKDELKGEKMVVTCISYLLYPPFADKLPEGSNIKKFYKMFDIKKIQDDESNGEFWYIFNVDYSEENFAKVQPKTTLQKVLYDHIKDGGIMGFGYGFLEIDENF